MAVTAASGTAVAWWAAGGLVVAAASLAAAAPARPLVVPDAPVATFAGTVDVNTVNLFVSVLDGDGLPVPGLSAADFTVREDGEPRDITNFRAVTRAEGEPEMVVTLVADEGDTAAAPTEPDAQPTYLAILFDSTSLQGRNQRRVVAGLEDFVRAGVARGAQVLVAGNTGQLEILRNFTAYEAAALASLERAADQATTGETRKSARRYLKRSIFRVDLFKARRMMNSTEFDLEYSRAQGHMLITEINALRRQEYNRIRDSIRVADQLLQALGGLPGRKVVLWVGEDLSLRPGLDLYTAFYRKAVMLSMVLDLVRPEVWGEELELRDEFRALAASAQACNAAVYVIDASDRDREASSVDFSPAGVDSIVATEAGGAPWTPGIDLAEERNLVEGSELVALASGGESFTPGRNVSAAVTTIERQLVSYYSLAYQRPGAPDGRQHAVKVTVRGDGLRVHHHERVLDRTPPQRLVDLTMSRLRLDAGDNPLGLELDLGGQEADGADRVIQTVRLGLPVENLGLVPNQGDRYRGQLLVAVVVIDAEGNTAAPQLLRLSLDLGADQLAPDVVAQQAIRLLMKPGTLRIAIGVRDEVSGVESSSAVAVAVTPT